MNKDRFNVINNVKDFINYIDTLLVNYPRTSFNLKNRIEATSYDLLELLFLTNIIDNRINNQKIIISKISMLDYYLEVSYNKKYISFKKMNVVDIYSLSKYSVNNIVVDNLDIRINRYCVNKYYSYMIKGIIKRYLYCN